MDEILSCLQLYLSTRLNMSQPHFGLSVKMKLTLPKLGIWSPPGLPNVQSSTAEAKTPQIGVFLVSLERSSSVDAQKSLALVIWTSAAQVMGKRMAGSQTGSLTPDHKKSGIDLFPTSADGVRWGVGKLSKRATTLVQTSLELEVKARSSECPKSRESNPGQFRDSNLRVPGQCAIWMQLPRGAAKNIIWGKVVASPESGPW